jgi:hypothetical protein
MTKVFVEPPLASPRSANKKTQAETRNGKKQNDIEKREKTRGNSKKA